MKHFIHDFNQRVSEVDNYFTFVKFIDEVETHKLEKISTSSLREFTPRRDLQKVLRSNCFLLLYNLMESSVRNSILTVYDCVHDESLKYEELSPKLKEIWLAYKSSKIPETQKSTKNWIKSLMDDVASGASIKLEKETLNISGNLDYESVMRIVDSYGFYGSINIDKKRISNDLAKIKRERNLLAHGNKTFSQSGEIITMKEIIDIKNNLISFFTQLLSNIDTYIDNKKFKA